MGVGIALRLMEFGFALRYGESKLRQITRRDGVSHNEFSESRYGHVLTFIL